MSRPRNDKSASGYLTPPELAERLRIDPGKVIAWIRAGELRAANVATSRGGRPRWRISELDLETFLASRAAIPRQKTQRRKRTPSGNIIPFFA